jgi:mitochondrial intermediate peptidase
MLARTARNILPKRPRTQFSFRGCLRVKPNVFKRTLALAASSVTIPASPDDIALVTLFDNAKRGSWFSAQSPTGLFGHDSITEPQALTALADATLVRAKLLTERILQARQSREEMLKVIKNLDRLSDMLCGVIDLAELVRNSHPDQNWVRASNEAYESLCEFMNVLNTHVELYEVRLSLSQSVQSCIFIFYTGAAQRLVRSHYRTNT